MFGKAKPIAHLELSPAAFSEVVAQLEQAGHGSCVIGTAISIRGVDIVIGQKQEPVPDAIARHNARRLA